MSTLTGKQTAFIHAYLGEARFNAAQAAKLAGYKATSKHGFESIGSENLTKPEIRKAIDEHFQFSRMSADEVLTELARLGKSRDHKDQIKALKILSEHHGLLDGTWQRNGNDPVTLKVVYDAKQERDKEWQVEVERAQQEANNEGRAFYENLIKIYQEAPDQAAVSEAITLAQTLLDMFKIKGSTTDEGQEKILAKVRARVNPPKQLPAAPVERMMNEVIEVYEPEIVEPEIVEPQPELCRHGYGPGECNVIEVGYDCPYFHRRDESKYRYA